VAGVSVAPRGYLLTVSCLGLYGPSSPLPTFYTEQLFEERLAEGSVCRDFLDLVNQRLYELFYQCLDRSRLRWLRQHDPSCERRSCLVGLGEPSLRREEGADLAARYAGLFGMRTRSAAGLAALLEAELGLPVVVVQCLQRTVAVPEEQRAGLGQARIGEALLGERVADASGSFRIRLGPLDRPGYQALLLEGALRKRLDLLVASYLRTPLTWEVELVLEAGQAEGICLGRPGGGRLGYDSWLAPDNARRNRASFACHTQG